jgi:hypothetical protein
MVINTYYLSITTRTKFCRHNNLNRKTKRLVKIMDDQDDDKMVIAEAERDVLLVVLYIVPLTYINDDVICSDGEGDNGSISKHSGVVTVSSTSVCNGEEDLFDNDDDDDDETE